MIKSIFFACYLVAMTSFGVAAIAQDTPRKQCTAIATSTKKQCKNKAVKDSETCHVHNKANQCGAVRDNGEKCKSPKGKDGGPCWRHQ